MRKREFISCVVGSIAAVFCLFKRKRKLAEKWSVDLNQELACTHQFDSDYHKIWDPVNMKDIDFVITTIRLNG